jgi:hypothetical protein
MENNPYSIAEYVLKNNPKAITAMLRKYGYNPLNVTASPTLILEILATHGQLALVDLFEGYWSIVKPHLNSYDGPDYIGNFFNTGGSSSPVMGPPAPTATQLPTSEPEKKKNFWETFTNVFSAVTGGVNAASGLIQNIKQPKQPAPAPTGADGTILGMSKLAFFGIVIVVVVVIVAVIAKAKK